MSILRIQTTALCRHDQTHQLWMSLNKYKAIICRLFHLLWVQRVQQIQQRQNHQRVPVERKVRKSLSNGTSLSALCSQHDTYRRSRNSLKTRMSTQTLHASLSLVSSNSFLTTGSSGALNVRFTTVIHTLLFTCFISDLLLKSNL